MSKAITVAICGCGNRGLEAYAPFALRHPDKLKIVAGADPRPQRLDMLHGRYGVPRELCFASAGAMLEKPRLADVMIISTQDQYHIEPAMAALEKGYHLLLEKPISSSPRACIALAKKAHQCARLVLVCHVLRYTPFYRTIEKLLSGGAIGRLETLDAMEHVAYWHFAHSYVRGNWRREDISSPMILAKCCHDMDILRWLAGDRCESVQSFGSLDFFRPENAPAGSAQRCLDCAVRDACPYDAEKIYLTNAASGYRSIGPGWPCSVLADNPTEEALCDQLRNGDYGRCVFRCDNDVCDRQTVNLRFANGVLATFTVSAFTEKCYRSLRATGTLGDIEGNMDENLIRVHRFGKPGETIDIGSFAEEYAGHGGGDEGLMQCLCDLLNGGEVEGMTGIDASVESHIMAHAAELSRRQGGRTIDMEELAGALAQGIAG